MSRHLPSVGMSETVKALMKAGFEFLQERGKGSHRAFRNPKTGKILIVPDHDPIKKGTLRAIIRQAGLSVEEFRELL